MIKKARFAEVYLTAAELIDMGLGRYSCKVVDSCAGALDGGIRLFSHERELYERTMGEGDDGDDGYFISIGQFEPEDTGHYVTPKARDLRVLALCFMAAACEDLS